MVQGYFHFIFFTCSILEPNIYPIHIRIFSFLPLDLSISDKEKIEGKKGRKNSKEYIIESLSTLQQDFLNFILLLRSC